MFLFYHNLWTAILSIKAVEALKLIEIIGIVPIFKNYWYVPQQKTYLSTISGPCYTRTELVSILYLPIAVHLQ